MAYPASNKIKKHYDRPDAARDFVSYHKVDLEPESDKMTEVIVAPVATKVRPSGNYNLYDEATGVADAATNVIASGTPLVVTEAGGTTGRRVGILTHDIEPGKVAQVAVEGLHLMQVEFDSSADHTISSLDPDDLAGKPAYFNIETGKVTDDNAADLLIGIFTGGRCDLKPTVGPISGVWYASVELQPALMNSNSAASIATAGSTTQTTSIYLAVTISAHNGLYQELTITGGSNDPRYEFLDHSMTVSIETVQVYSGPAKGSFAATFTAGAGQEISVTLTDPAGNSTTKDYTVTISASAAPASFTEV
jgi:hypothetical protein